MEWRIWREETEAVESESGDSSDDGRTDDDSGYRAGIADRQQDVSQGEGCHRPLGDATAAMNPRAPRTSMTKPVSIC